MVREAKFRGFSKETNLWHYGHGHFLIEHTEESKIENYTVLHTEQSPVHVDPLSVGEFTGLKDFNGKEVYEGDILQASNGEKGWYVVVWRNAAFQRKYRFMRKYEGEQWEEHSYVALNTQHFKVIGNIYEQDEPMN